MMLVTGFLGSTEIGRHALAAQEQATQPPAIEIIVVAKDTGKRLPDATVRLSIDFKAQSRKADRDGVVRQDLTQREFQDALDVDVWADGYVQQRHFFAQNDSRYPKIPSHLNVELLPAQETLGGKVVDEQNRPIAGVTVTIWGHLGEKKEKHELAYMVDATTNEKGDWRCRCFRSMKFAYLYLSHPDFLSDGESHPREHGQPQGQQKPRLPAVDQPLAALRDFSDVQVMTAGTSLAGKVTDEQDKPIAGAEVGWLEGDRQDIFHEAMPVTLTDVTGRFRFPHVRPSALVVQIKAKGYAPAVRPLDGIDRAGHLTIKLGRPRSISGRITDSDGKAIPDAFVNIDTWRGSRALGVFLKSDSLGRFRWDDAPPDEFSINVSRRGFTTISRRRVAPEEHSLSLNLSRSLRISGQISDIETGESIESAVVEVGLADSPSGAVSWTQEPTAFAFRGTLHGNVDVENRSAIRLRVSSTGYEPAVSRVFRRDENQVEFDVKLKKASQP